MCQKIWGDKEVPEDVVGGCDGTCDFWEERSKPAMGHLRMPSSKMKREPARQWRCPARSMRNDSADASKEVIEGLPRGKVMASGAEDDLHLAGATEFNGCLGEKAV